MTNFEVPNRMLISWALRLSQCLLGGCHFGGSHSSNRRLRTNWQGHGNTIFDFHIWGHVVNHEALQPLVYVFGFSAPALRVSSQL